MARRTQPDSGATTGGGQDDARAGRAALLDLLADLLLRELDPSLARTLAADPALAEALQPPGDEAAIRALRAEYARLILLEAPPYASLFLEAPPVIGGESARHWETTLAASGIPALPLERASASDHAGLYLRALASAERRGAPAPILTEALRWLPQYLTTLERADPDGFYGRVAQLAAYALSESARHAAPTIEPAVATPPDIPPPEDDRLRTLARWLCTPLWSGWYLTPGALRALARALGSAPGRTDRAALLEQVFEASGLDNRAPELLDALLATLDAWDASAHAWSEQLGAWSATLAPWRASLAQTHAILTAMREEARAGASGDGRGW
jgi:putative dimethyl sulfoxide reductase chaperone